MLKDDRLGGMVEQVMVDVLCQLPQRLPYVLTLNQSRLR